MKANYHNSLNNKPHTKRIILVAVGLVLVVIIFHSILSGPVSVFNNIVFTTSNWLYNSTGTIPSYFRDRNDLREEISDLKSKVAGYDGDRKTVSSLIEENKHLKLLLSSTDEPRILANIIGRPPQLPFDAILVDIGSNDGIKENAIAYIHDNKAIGIVARVYPNSSLVALATSPGVESSVYVIGPDIYATAFGDGGGVLRVEVPQGVILEEGNPVVVPAISSGVYGLISSVVSVPTEPVQVGYVTVGTPIQSLRSVTISLEAPDTVTFEEAQAAVAEAVKSQLIIDIPSEYASSSATSTAATSTETTQ
jgi:cell shape-determining protein MreC